METANFSYIDACGFNSLPSLRNSGSILSFYDKYINISLRMEDFIPLIFIENGRFHTTNILLLPTSRLKYVKSAIFLLFKSNNKQEK